MLMKTKVFVFDFNDPDKSQKKLSELLNDNWRIEKTDCVHVSASASTSKGAAHNNIVEFGPVIYILSRNT